MKLREQTRRHFFCETGFGIGSLALLSLADARLFAAPPQAADPLRVKPPHFEPKAKRVIFLFMAGAPSQVDLFDPKPKLKQHDGEPIPEELVKGERFAFIKGVPKLLGSPYEFKRHGQSGATVSNLLPHLTTIVDDVAFVKSVHTNHFNHAPAQVFDAPALQVAPRGRYLTLEGVGLLIGGVDLLDVGRVLLRPEEVPAGQRHENQQRQHLATLIRRQPERHALTSPSARAEPCGCRRNRPRDSAPSH